MINLRFSITKFTTDDNLIKENRSKMIFLFT